MYPYKADLHVHSPYSQVEKRILRGIISSESYTSPREIYRIAKKRGMDFVTITDHNCIEGALEIAHLPGVFIGEEVTAKFPEDGCSIHLITLDINEAQHREIQRLRDNIYELVKYLSSQDIVYFVAHPFSSVDGKLKKEHWEKMLLLFDIFEAKNGVQKEEDNLLLERILKSLSPEKIEQLVEKYNITPLSSTPWKKSMVGGSDDHGGLYIAKTYTLGGGPSPGDFLKSIKEGRCKPGGKSGSYLTIGHSIYSTGYRFYKYRVKKDTRRFIDRLVDDERKGKILEKVFLSNGRKGLPLFPKNFLVSYFIRKFSRKMPFLSTIEAIDKINKNLPLYIALFPYLFGFAYQNKDRNFTREIEKHYLGLDDPLKVAVFLDGKGTGKGLSSNLYSSSSDGKGEIEILRCDDVNKKGGFSENGITSFSPIVVFPFSLYPGIQISIPPLMEVLLHCEKKKFALIHALTPGPMGISGIIASKILKLPIIGSYHVDFFKLISSSFSRENTFKNALRWYFSWFYGQMDRVIVASRKYVKQLEGKGVSPEKIEFIPGIESEDGLSFDESLKVFSRDESFNSLWEVYRKVSLNSDEKRDNGKR